ncbi:hypothetical protein [Kineosporia sp. A_224]|uniref:hypothetical protein n=1 Tax=Kineosporia sp. A_224 TaxID=1962180 RepID=UPI00117A1755|nr:hypothetical protein [Kineosporia sp. A_224]
MTLGPASPAPDAVHRSGDDAAGSVAHAEPVEPSGRRRIRRVATALAVVVAGVALLVWPVSALWQDTRVTTARLLLRPATLVTDPGQLTALGVPADDAGAATAFLGWDEPLRLADSCRTRATVTLPAGWVLQSVFMIPGQVVVAQSDRSRVVVEQAAGAERFLRPTFVAATAAAGGSDVRATGRVERVCDGAVASVVDVDLVVETRSSDG